MSYSFIISEALDLIRHTADNLPCLACPQFWDESVAMYENTPKAYDHTALLNTIAINEDYVYHGESWNGDCYFLADTKLGVNLYPVIFCDDITDPDDPQCYTIGYTTDGFLDSRWFDDPGEAADWILRTYYQKEA